MTVNKKGKEIKEAKCVTNTFGKSRNENLKKRQRTQKWCTASVKI